MEVYEWDRVGEWKMAPRSYRHIPHEETEDWMQTQIAQMLWRVDANRPRLLICFYCGKTFGADARRCYWCANE